MVGFGDLVSLRRGEIKGHVLGPLGECWFLRACPRSLGGVAGFEVFCYSPGGVVDSGGMPRSPGGVADSEASRFPMGVAGFVSFLSPGVVAVWGACPRSHGGMAGSGGCPRSPAGVAGSGGVSVPWWRGEFWGFLLGFIGAWRVDRVSSVSSWSVGFLGRVLGPLRRAGLGASRAPGGVANLESVYSVFWGCGGFGGMFWSPGAVPAAGALSLVPWRVAG